MPGTFRRLIRHLLQRNTEPDRYKPLRFFISRFFWIHKPGGCELIFVVRSVTGHQPGLAQMSDESATTPTRAEPEVAVGALAATRTRAAGPDRTPRRGRWRLRAVY